MRSMNEKLLQSIGEFVAERKFSNESKPTVTEIQEKYHIARGTAYKYLTTAEKKGYCSKAEKYIRDSFSKAEIINAPISCGSPTYEEGHIEEYVKLPGSMFGEDDKLVLYADGDSMTGVDIKDKDILVISKRNDAKDGEIVVALVNGATTLKTLMHHEDGRPYLHPENEAYDDIEISEGESFYIQGVLTYVIKNYRNYKSNVVYKEHQK